MLGYDCEVRSFSRNDSFAEARVELFFSSPCTRMKFCSRASHPRLSLCCVGYNFASGVDMYDVAPLINLFFLVSARICRGGANILEISRLPYLRQSGSNLNI